MLSLIFYKETESAKGPDRSAIRKEGLSSFHASMWMFCLLVLACTAIQQAKAQLPFGADQSSNNTSSGSNSSTSTSPSILGGTNTTTGLSGSQDSQTAQTSINGLVAPAALSSDQIITILQESPDLTLELKSQLADRMQQQGMQVNAADISDESLYDQISNNANLRVTITSYLRMHGYVSDSDLQLARSSSDASESELGSSVSGSNSLSGRPDGITSSSDMLRTGEISSDGTPATTLRGSMGSRSDLSEPRSHEEVHSSTDKPKVIRQPAPYDLQAMRDLYAQLPEPSTPLKRFGSDVFLNRNASSASRGISGSNTPLDVPLGPDYVIGPGDTLSIQLWGSTTQTLTRMVDRDGRVLLPEAGSFNVAGLPLGRTQTLIENALKQQYRNAQVAITVSRLRSVRVYVVGDVQRPGGFDISSLSTPLSALYAAGGPTAAGSLRQLKHYRGQQLVEDVDLYDFLLHGIRVASARFESGDTLLVPPAGAQIAISGAVKRPAIYELKQGESTLANVLDDAGSLTVAASPGNITVERIDANRHRETVTLKSSSGQTLEADRAAISDFHVQDGDRIHVAPILPYSERAVYLEGHVARPGRKPYTDGMRLGDVLHSYRDLLPEPDAHGQIIRLVPPDLHAEAIDFDVPEVLIGNGNVDLQPFDTIHIFGRYENDAPKVTVRGEVYRPGIYPLSKGMTAAQLVRMAGGFKRDALLDRADLTSYGVFNGNNVTENLATVAIGQAVSGNVPGADITLKPGDILTIHQITGWSDIGESITIDGQVNFPGSYGFKEGERLSSVLRRAGGFRDTAYPEGSVLVRDQVRELEEKSRDELIRQIETNSATARLSPAIGGGADAAGTLQLIKAQQNEVLSQLKSHPATGRMVIRVSADINSWANTADDIELRRGDVLTIPKRPGFVLVTGQVYNATALTFTPDKTASWYLSNAGGTNTSANRKEIFIIRANGSVVGRRSSGWFEGDVLSTKLNPGDVVVVPQKILGSSLFWRNLLTTAQLASSIAITAAVAGL